MIILGIECLQILIMISWKIMRTLASANWLAIKLFANGPASWEQVGSWKATARGALSARAAANVAQHELETAVTVVQTQYERRSRFRYMYETSSSMGPLQIECKRNQLDRFKTRLGNFLSSCNYVY